MADYMVDFRDVQFVLYEMLGVDKLCEREKFQDFNKEIMDMVLEQGLKFSKEILAPINAVADKEGCKFEDGKVSLPECFHDAYKQYCEGGWTGISSNPEFGGQGMPTSIAIAVAEFFIGSCVSFGFTPGLSHGAAGLIESFATDELKATYCEKMYTGEWAGTMCLTEPQAGSAVGDSKTTAKKKGDDWYINGTKSFISSGDHDLTENIIHLVLARTEGAPAGIKGISLFVVPKFRVGDDGSSGESNDVVCGNIEHKMGIHGSSTCTLNFGDNDACIGFLVGEECAGIKYMFQMMNEARIGVGMQGLGQAAAAYQAALAYARERIQGVDIREMKNVDAPRVAIIEHPDIRRMLMLMKAYTEGCRALLYETAYYEDLAQSATDDEDRDGYEMMVELMTPICKAYSTDVAFRVAEWGIQVLGGYGYCSEYPLEQYMRDIKILSIYEGTNGIQALDLLGRKIAMKGGMLFMKFIMELNGFVEANKEHARLAVSVAALEKAKDTLSQVTMKFGELSMSGDVLYPVLYATPYLEMFGEVTIAHILLRQAVIANEKLEAIYAEKGADTDEAKANLVKENDEAKYYSGKIHSAEFFAAYVLPGVDAKAATAMSQNRTPLEIEF